ncbi:cell division protein FtsZ [uncultured Anaerovibrio sp.]|uniref:cell division protein FtsZ n=1 Tax=uncultured Anaerovibrio sp. TaxID=361586 RepID=UPI0025CEB814|nr:cell division protein FtsZ [uncultured Anaerovibrio sp.]
MARFKVVGVGGGGINAVNSMINAGIKDVEFISIDFAPSTSLASKHITLGSNTEECAKAADEHGEEILCALKDADMVIIVAGIGGTTGTSAAQVVAKCSKKIGAFTFGVVIYPFLCEGDERAERAKNGINDLRNVVDSILVIPSEKLFNNLDKSTSLIDKFKEIDDIIRHGVQSICDIGNGYSFVGADLDMIKAVIGNNKFAYVGIGEAAGNNAPLTAFGEAINSPFIEEQLCEAKGIIVHFIGDASQFNLLELNETVMNIGNYVHPEANIMWTGVLDDAMGDKVRAIVVATSQCRDYE